MARKKKTLNTTEADFSQIAKTLDEVKIEQFVGKSFLAYSYAVIMSRAIPDARDGLKPVHRRIAYTMHKAGFTHNKSHVKSSRVVGEVMGKHHPHGDSAIYDALVGLKREFNMMVPLIDGYGNFGLVGDPAAAPRYTESRLAPEAALMLEELRENAVDMVPNYDGSEIEPSVLPAKFPNMLINGTAGIAVGMASKMPTHNPTEIMDAARYLLKRPNATLEQLMKYVPGPDFPTGGEISGIDEIKKGYETGRGIFHIRARYRIESLPRGRSEILFYEMPYDISIETVISSINANMNKGKLQGISEARDLTDRNNPSLLSVLVKTGINPAVIVEELFKATALQTSFGINNTVIHNGEPVCIGLKPLLQIFLDHRKEVISRRTQSQLDRHSKRLNQVEGLLRVLLDIDAAIEIIRKSADVATAKTKLMKKFKLNDEQAVYVLDLQLRRLTRMDQHALKNEEKEILAEIARLTSILADDQELAKELDRELVATKKIIAKDRSSVIIDGDLAEIIADRNEQLKTESLEIEDEPCLINVHASGALSRTLVNRPKLTRRGKIDPIVGSIATTTRGLFVAVTNKGNGHRLNAMLINHGTANSAKQLGIDLSRGEKFVVVSPEAIEPNEAGLALGTRMGSVKISITDFPKTLDQFPVMLLADGDEIVGGRWVKDADNTMFAFISSDASFLRFNANLVRPQGSKGGGVVGMKLAPNARVLDFAVLDNDTMEQVIVVTGTGKTIKQSQAIFAAPKGRATAGMRYHLFQPKLGEKELSFAAIGVDQIIVSTEGKEIKLPTAVKRDATGRPEELVPAVRGIL